MSHKLEIETPITDKTTICISRENYRIIKKLGYSLECDSMNEAITKILEQQQQGVNHLNG